MVEDLVRLSQDKRMTVERAVTMSSMVAGVSVVRWALITVALGLPAEEVAADMPQLRSQVTPAQAAPGQNGIRLMAPVEVEVEAGERLPQ
jgi:hypothetical protein